MSKWLRDATSMTSVYTFSRMQTYTHLYRFQKSVLAREPYVYGIECFLISIDPINKWSWYSLDFSMNLFIGSSWSTAEKPLNQPLQPVPVVDVHPVLSLAHFKGFFLNEFVQTLRENLLVGNSWYLLTIPSYITILYFLLRVRFVFLFS